ncbi:PilW family protein [Gilvimarinus japonicus]|uniref:PilW family protein n=1 Tax=Gilvimarinus japonicus TaxID=1796469 RepID=A0ABV7HVD4_9GAMM
MAKQKGFSLIELMVAITISLLLMAGVVQMFLSSKTVFTTQQGLSRLQETGRLAVEFMARDVRQAGFFGPAYATSWNMISTLNNKNQFGNDYSPETAMRVFNGDSLPAGLVLNPAPNSDTQVVAVYTASDMSVPVVQQNDSGNVYVELTTPAGQDCPSGICEGDILVAADFEKMWIFQVTGVSENGGMVTLAHGAGSDPGNQITEWGGNPDYPTQDVNPGAEVFRLKTSVFYIADGPNNIPTLYQKVGREPSFPLLVGVENIFYNVGVDTDADRVANNYVAPEAVANWENAVSLQLEALVMTPGDNAASDKQTYTFAGEEVTADDNRVRKVFRTTVAIRNKLL